MRLFYLHRAKPCCAVFILWSLISYSLAKASVHTLESHLEEQQGEHGFPEGLEDYEGCDINFGMDFEVNPLQSDLNEININQTFFLGKYPNPYKFKQFELLPFLWSKGLSTVFLLAKLGHEYLLFRYIYAKPLYLLCRQVQAAEFNTKYCRSGSNIHKASYQDKAIISAALLSYLWSISVPFTSGMGLIDHIYNIFDDKQLKESIIGGLFVPPIFAIANFAIPRALDLLSRHLISDFIRRHPVSDLTPLKSKS